MIEMNYYKYFGKNPWIHIRKCGLNNLFFHVHMLTTCLHAWIFSKVFVVVLFRAPIPRWDESTNRTTRVQ